MWQGIDEVDVLDEQKLDSDLGRARNANMLHVNPGAGELHPDFERGDGKELGHIIEFRSGIDLAYRRNNGSRIGAEVHHLSNASLDENNPGTETFLFTYSVPLN